MTTPVVTTPVVTTPVVTTPFVTTPVVTTGQGSAAQASSGGGGSALAAPAPQLVPGLGPVMLPITLPGTVATPVTVPARTPARPQLPTGGTFTGGGGQTVLTPAAPAAPAVTHSSTRVALGATGGAATAFAAALPFTGVSHLPDLLAAGIGSLVGGMFLVVAARRRMV
ncbi:MAG: hypothetical protein M3N21_02250 [Actinomycetota bacterium]|nr:hypothetical protein [Actinomycetota bacterium]